MMLGDMYVVGEPPAKLLKALAVIADVLHPTFGKLPWIAHSEKSKESCILCSLAVRDFLFKIGFRDAEVAPVVCVMRTDDSGKLIHSLSIGNPDLTKCSDPGCWSGHMVVRLPSVGYVIDTTLYQANRPVWEQLPGMMAVPIENNLLFSVFDLEPIAGLHTMVSSVTFNIIWLDQPKNKGWRKGGDAIRWRREAVAEAMREKFGNWKEAG